MSHPLMQEEDAGLLACTVHLGMVASLSLPEGAVAWQ